MGRRLNRPLIYVKVIIICQPNVFVTCYQSPMVIVCSYQTLCRLSKETLSLTLVVAATKHVEGQCVDRLHFVKMNVVNI